MHKRVGAGSDRVWSRRQLGTLLIAAPLAAQKPEPAPEQPAAEPKRPTPQDPAARAAANMREATGKLRSIKLPMDVEPAFSFSAL